MSALSFFRRSPTLIQLNGLMELITEKIFRPFGAGSLLYWVFPGNRKEGYCNEKEKMEQSSPSSLNSFASLWSNVANPPRSGWAGPIMMTFGIRSQFFLQ